MIRKNMYMNSTFTWIGGFSGLVMHAAIVSMYITFIRQTIPFHKAFTHTKLAQFNDLFTIMETNKLYKLVG